MTKLKTTAIHGKEYVEVNQRIKWFCENYKNGQILTELVSDENGKCVFKAQAIVNGVIISTGHAYEKEGSSNINKTSYIENCETSAIGRCLGIAGIGIDGSVATYEEVQNAIAQQKEVDAEKEKFDAEVAQYVVDITANVVAEDAEGTHQLLDEISESKALKANVWTKLSRKSHDYIKDLLKTEEAA